MKRIFLFFLLFGLFCNLYASSNGDIYKRNGLLYVMIGDGKNKGVYGPFRATQETVVVTDGHAKNAQYLFSPGTFGKAIGADLFGNVYCLSADNAGKFGPPRLTNKELARLAGEGYPEMGDLNAGNFYRIGKGLNKVPIYAAYGGPGAVANGTPAGGGTWAGHWGHGYQAAAHGKNRGRWPLSGVGDFARVYSYGNNFWKDDRQYVVIPNGFGMDTSVNGILPNGRPTHMRTASHYGCSQFSWILDFVERHITYWDAYYQDPKHIIQDAGDWDVYADTFSGFEKVFKDFQDNYKYQCEASACNDSPPGEDYGAQPMPTCGLGYMCICITCTGHRYFYQDVPEPILKVGLMETDVASGAEMDPVNPNLLAYCPPRMMPDNGSAEQIGAGMLAQNGLQLNPGNDPNGNPPDYTHRTTSIGAATRDRSGDWIYLSEAPDMSVADQWDGHGGIIYELQAAGDDNTPGQIRMRNMEGNPTGMGNQQTCTNDMTFAALNPGKIYSIAGDGIGNLYYMIKKQELQPPGWDPDNSPGVIANVRKYVPAPGDPPIPGVTHMWDVYLGDGWFGTVYRCKENAQTTNQKRVFKIFLGGNVYRRQEFGTYLNGVANCVVKAKAALDVSSSVDASKIDVDLAVINIAGPPIADDDIAHIDIIGPLGRDIDGAKPDEDFVEEDNWYEFSVENPPSFRGDPLDKQDNFGESELQKRPTNNHNPFTGGYPISLVEKAKDGRPGLVYYFRVLDSLTGKQLLEWWMPNATPTIPGQVNGGLPANENVKLVTEKLDRTVLNTPDNYVYADGTDIEKKGFSLYFKDPGVYYVQAMAVYLRYNYEEMPFPSFMNERIELGYYYATSDRATFSWRDKKCKLKGGWTTDSGLPDAWGTATIPGDPNFIAQRTLHVKHRSIQVGQYITHIKIRTTAGGQDATGLSGMPGGNYGFKVMEDVVTPIRASFYVQWAKYLQPYQAGPPPAPTTNDTEVPSSWLDEYNGIGVWNYAGGGMPNNAVPGAGDANNMANCLRGNPGDPVPGGKDNNLDGKITLEDYPYNGFDVPKPNGDVATRVGTFTGDEDGSTPNPISPGQATPIPGNALIDKDWESIKFAWYVGAYIWDSKANPPFFRWFQTKVRDGNLTDRNLVVSKVRAKEIDAFDRMPEEGQPPADMNRRKLYRVEIKLDPADIHKWVMPLSPADDQKAPFYYVWVEFNYPTLDWQPRDMQPPEANATPVPSYYDLVCGADARNSYRNIDNTAAQYVPPEGDVSKFKSYLVEVKDKEGPALYYKHRFIAKGDGSTTGDIFPRNLDYLVVDNNPNHKLNQSDFNMLIQIANPSARDGNGKYDNNPDSEQRNVYHDYQCGIPNPTELGGINFEGALIDTESGDYNKDVCNISGDGKIQNDFDKMVINERDDTDYYQKTGAELGLLRHIHRYMYLRIPKDTVGPMAANYDNLLYWFVCGKDATGNTMNMQGSSWTIPPRDVVANVPWSFLAKVDNQDNDAPELMFLISIPKLGRVINFIQADDDRDNIFDDPKYGFADESMNSAVISAASPEKTALSDTMVWDENTNTLLELDNLNGTKRGRIRITVTGDGVEEPKLERTVLSDYFLTPTKYELDPADKPSGASCMESPFFNFMEYLKLKPEAGGAGKPYVIGIDEDMRVMFEVRARDNVDYIEPEKLVSHNLMQEHGGSGNFPFTFQNAVKEITHNFTQGIEGELSLPNQNISIDNIYPDQLRHAVCFFQFRDSTRIDLNDVDRTVEWIKVEVKDKAGNIRAFEIPFRILDTKLMDELLKRKKMDIKFNNPDGL
ncbi:MAG: hypothetical protein PHW04_06440 [Candidatus Wallbacteria bacterium]|nr:hypothetical protein [Candidatus Wallbacteria bacterium]